MLRFMREEEAQSPGEGTRTVLSDMELPDSDKYWVTGGMAECDTSEEPDVDGVDIIATIESFRYEKLLKMPILCSMCLERNPESSFFAHTHWSYQHCLSCPKFFACQDCSTSDAFGTLKITEHQNHRFVRIQSRPLQAPLHDGSENDQLVLFKDATSAKDFFLYFPWFFHCFAGFDQVRNFNRQQTIEAMERMPDRGSEHWLGLRELQDFPVDWYIRCFGSGDWRPLHQSMMPLINSRIQTASLSAELHELLCQLQYLDRVKQAKYGEGDIPAHPAAFPYIAVATSLSPTEMEYILYTMPLQFMTVLDSEIDQAALQRLFHDPVPLSATQALINQFSNLLGDGTGNQTEREGHATRLAPDVPLYGSSQELTVLIESARLWPMFRVIFEDHPNFKDLKRPIMATDISSFFEYMKPEWHTFLARDYTIREYMLDIRYHRLPEISATCLDYLDERKVDLESDVEFLAAYMEKSNQKMERMRQGYGVAFVQEDLDKARLQRQLGNYQEAAKMLANVGSGRDVQVFLALELQRIYLEQGRIKEATDCYGEVAQLEAHEKALPSADLRSLFGHLNRNERESTDLSRPLLQLVSQYLDCLAKGEWVAALHGANKIFDKYLRTWPHPHTIDGDYSLIVYLELYYHRIVLEASRDLSLAIERGPAIARLKSIREYLSKLPSRDGLADLAWDVLQVELELRKRTIRDQYFDFEAAFSVPAYLHTPSEVVPILESFCNSRLLQGPDGRSPAVRASALMILAEISLKDGDAAESRVQVQHAEEVFQRIGDHGGLLDVEILRIQLNGSGSRVPYQPLISLYENLRERNDIRRMRKVRRFTVAVPGDDTPEMEWQLFQRASLRELAREAGDDLMHQRWNLRKYAGDHLAVSSIDNAVKAINGDGDRHVHSNLLATIASFNLSKAYLNVGNFFEAALNAMLHLHLTEQHDGTESHQRAILNVLSVYSETIAAQQSIGQAKLLKLARYWNGWLSPNPYERWRAGHPRCDEIDWFIDGACFLPNLAARVSTPAGRFTGLEHDEQFEKTMIAHLRIAFALSDALPTYLSSTVLPKLAMALGSAAAFIGNQELGVRAYAQGLKSCHTQDGYNIACLRLLAGRLMTALGGDDPEHWLHVVPAGRSLLEDAASQFFSHQRLASALMKFCEANVALSTSFVTEARARKRFLTEQVSETEEFNETLQMQCYILIDVFRRTSIPLLRCDRAIDIIADRLNIASPFESSQNLASLASNHLACRNRELALELSLITQDFESIIEQQAGTNTWAFVQRYKASSVYRRLYFSPAQPHRYLKQIQEDKTALDLYLEEQRLIKEGPQGMSDHRYDDVHLKMMDHPALKPLMERRTTRRVTQEDFHPLADTARITHGDSVSLVLVDWIQYHDYFIIVAYNVTEQRILLCDVIVDCPVFMVQEWVETHLDVDSTDLRRTLGSADIFKPLYPVVRAVKENCKEGDLLVFSPSQLLNSIPLHALPYSDSDDALPVIFHHPIVYAPSNSILKECVERTLDQEAQPAKASLFGRYGTATPQEVLEQTNIENSMLTITKELQSVNISTTTVSGKDLTHDSFQRNIPHADILHFHGHVDGRDLKQHLTLEPESTPALSTGSFSTGSISPFANLRSTPRRDIYSLQDAFATPLSARLVVLMGCGSGTQFISRADDALGLITSFFATGATTVIGTLWPFETADAATFSETFYKAAFTEQKGKDLIDLAGAIRKAVLEMKACKRRMCLRKSLEKRLKCHSTDDLSPYHWAGFAGWGSWVCRGVRTADDVEESKATAE